MSLPTIQSGGLQTIKLPAGLPKITRVEALPAARRREGGDALRPSLRGGRRDRAAARLLFALRLFAPGHASTDWFPPDALPTKTLPASGTLRFEVSEKGKGAMPGRVLVRGARAPPIPTATIRARAARST